MVNGHMSDKGGGIEITTSWSYWSRACSSWNSHAEYSHRDYGQNMSYTLLCPKF